jgi:hypothetical protein
VISTLERLRSPPPLGTSQCAPPPEPGESQGASSLQLAAFRLWRDSAPGGSARRPPPPYPPPHPRRGELFTFCLKNPGHFFLYLWVSPEEGKGGEGEQGGPGLGRGAQEGEGTGCSLEFSVLVFLGWRAESPGDSAAAAPRATLSLASGVG